MKGQLFTLKNAAIFLIVAIIVLGGGSALYGFMTGVVDDSSCRTSASWNARFNVAGKSFFELNCERREVIISEKDMRNNVALEKVRSEIETCWNNMLRGKSEVFNKNFVLVAENPCLVCAQIEFKNPKKGTLDGLRNYMMEYDKGVLWNEIYGEQHEGEPVMELVNEKWVSAEMYTTMNYHMIYHLYNPAWEQLSWIPLVEEKDPKPLIMMVTKEDLHHLKCDYFYN